MLHCSHVDDKIIGTEILSFFFFFPGKRAKKKKRGGDFLADCVHVFKMMRVSGDDAPF